MIDAAIQRKKEDFKNTIKSQYSKRGGYEVEFDKKIQGTNQVFDVIIYKKRVRPPSSFILHDVVFGKSIDLEDVNNFKNKVEAVRSSKVKIEKAYIVGDKLLESIAKDKIDQLDGIGLPIGFMPWYEELGEELE